MKLLPEVQMCFDPDLEDLVNKQNKKNDQERFFQWRIGNWELQIVELFIRNLKSGIRNGLK